MKMWHTVAKSGWGEGPWQEEADKYSWTDEATGYSCLIVRNSFGALCGYVGISGGHPLFGKRYSDCVYPEKHKEGEPGEHDYHYSCRPEAALDVHGGITFTSACSPTDEGAWELAKAHYERCAGEADKYPKGDAAQFRKNAGPVINDYEAWRDYAQRRNICHIPEPGKGEVWWYGFDCGHYNDLSPATRDYGDGPARRLTQEGEYRDVPYVRGEILSLARQLKELENGQSNGS